MSKNKIPFSIFILYSALIFSLIYAIIIPFIDYATYYKGPFEENHLSTTITIIVASLFLAGIILKIAIIIDNKRSVKYYNKEQLIELFREYNSEQFQKIRNEAWAVKEKWGNNKNYKKQFLEYNFNDYKRKVDKELEAEINTIYKLLEFYRVVSLYSVDKSKFKSFKYFYYDWWRSFLYDIGSEIENKRGINDLVEETKNEYTNSISHTKNLEKLDKIFGLENIIKDIVIHNDGG